MNVHIIIPARFLSSRLPGKMLADIDGKPLIQHVYERALQCHAKSVTIATDHGDIKKAAEEFGAPVYMTSEHHPNGTARLAEAAQLLALGDEDVVVNIQGDEPFFSKEAVQVAIQAMREQPNAAVATLCTPILTEEEVIDPNVVKVVFDHQGFALYFSRSPIPFQRNPGDAAKHRYYRHLGLYVYRVKTLQKYIEWQPSPTETVESLEQLRVLWYGEKIHVSLLNESLPPDINTAQDLAKFRSLFDNKVIS